MRVRVRVFVCVILPISMCGAEVCLPLPPKNAVDANVFISLLYTYNYLINKQHTRHQLRDALLDVLVYDFVDFSAKLLSDFGFLRLRQLVHNGHDVWAEKK